VLGLVEVMKCFNQIVYGTDDASPDRGTIHRILAADASEVKYDQVLFVVKPD
jgi:biotin carboxyl carrier protein